MLQQSLVAVAALCCVVGCLAQDATVEGETEQNYTARCSGIRNYISTGFNSLRFTNTISYHDSEEFKVLYVNSEDENEWSLLDFNQGTFYANINGTCYYYHNDDAVISQDEWRAKMVPNYSLADYNGYVGSVGYTVENGEVTFRGVINEDCAEVFSYIAVGGVPYLAVGHNNITLDNVDSKVRKHLMDTRSVINGECYKMELPDPGSLAIQTEALREEPNITNSLALECQGFTNFIAETFNVLRFTSSISYHDAADSKTLYVDSENENDWALYDLNQGTIYTYVNGSCQFFYNDHVQVTKDDLRQQLEVNFEVEDFNGIPGVGYTSKNDAATFRGVFRDDCTEAFTYIAIDNVPYTVQFHNNIQTENVISKISYQLKNARSVVNKGKCVQSYDAIWSSGDAPADA